MILTNDFHSKKTRAAKISVVSNSFLVALKLLVGIITGSVSIISEATHSAVDLLASLIAYFSVKTSCKPPDKEHPYGHGKIENISGAIESILIIGASFWIIYESFKKFSVSVVPDKLELGIVIMLVSIIVNVLVSKHLFKVAKETQSHALEADALHLQADVWTSVGVLLGLLVIKITGLYWLDPLIAVVVACIILKAGFCMTKKSVSELLDTTITKENVQTITEILDADENVKRFSHLRTRRSGSTVLIDVHVILDKNLSFIQAHNICDEVEKSIKTEFEFCEIIIHAEPD